MIAYSTKDDLDALELALNRCLEGIQKGETSLDSILAQYPDFKEILIPPLEAAKWLLALRSRLDPLPSFRTLGRSRIVLRIQSQEPSGQNQGLKPSSIRRIPVRYFPD